MRGARAAVAVAAVAVVHVTAAAPAVAPGEWAPAAAPFGALSAQARAGDALGQAVALSASGEVVAGGAPFAQGANEEVEAGAAHSAARGGSWAVGGGWASARAPVHGGGSGDQLAQTGLALSGDGTTMAAGAMRAPNGSNTRAGYARIYAWSEDEAAWEQRFQVAGAEANEYSGSALALSHDGSTVAIGAYGHTSGGLNMRGCVRVYRESATGWSKVGDTLKGVAGGDMLGTSVGLSADGDVVAVGAQSNRENGINAGMAMVFAWDAVEGAWVQRGASMHGSAPNQRFGCALGLSADGTALVVGARGDQTFGTASGKAIVMEWVDVDSSWLQLGEAIHGEGQGERAGQSVAISRGATTVVAVGSPGWSSSTGRTRVFHWDHDTEWVMRGWPLNGSATGDGFGFSVALSQGGTTLAVGAYQADVTGTDSGSVHVFDFGGNLGAPPPGSPPPAIPPTPESPSPDGQWSMPGAPPPALDDGVPPFPGTPPPALENGTTPTPSGEGGGPPSPVPDAGEPPPASPSLSPSPSPSAAPPMVSTRLSATFVLVFELDYEALEAEGLLATFTSEYAASIASIAGVDGDEVFTNAAEDEFGGVRILTAVLLPEGEDDEALRGMVATGQLAEQVWAESASVRSALSADGGATALGAPTGFEVGSTGAGVIVSLDTGHGPGGMQLSRDLDDQRATFSDVQIEAVDESDLPTEEDDEQFYMVEYYGLPVYLWASIGLGFVLQVASAVAFVRSRRARGAGAPVGANLAPPPPPPPPSRPSAPPMPPAAQGGMMSLAMAASGDDGTTTFSNPLLQGGGRGYAESGWSAGGWDEESAGGWK